LGLWFSALARGDLGTSIYLKCPRITSTDVDVYCCKIGREQPPHGAPQKVSIDSSDSPGMDGC